MLGYSRGLSSFVNPGVSQKEANITTGMCGDDGHDSEADSQCQWMKEYAFGQTWCEAAEWLQADQLFSEGICGLDGMSGYIPR